MFVNSDCERLLYQCVPAALEYVVENHSSGADRNSNQHSIHFGCCLEPARRNTNAVFGGKPLRTLAVEVADPFKPDAQRPQHRGMVTVGNTTSADDADTEATNVPTRQE